MGPFATPWWLLLLPAGPLLAWWWLRRRRPALRHAAGGACATLPPGRARFARQTGAVLRAAAVTLLVLALAGPRLPDRSTRIETEGIALMLVLDVSGSMAEPTCRWPTGETISRLDAARRTFRLFLAGGTGPGGVTFPGRPHDLAGAVVFARHPDNLCPLTLSHDALLRLLDEEKPRDLPTESDTNIGDALVWGLRRLQAAAGDRRQVVVLVSDGEHNVGGDALKPRQAAQLLAQSGVRIYSIDCGGTPSAADPEAVAARQAGREAMQSVAHLTGGRCFEAGDGAALLEAGRAIDEIERGRIATYVYRRYHEAFPWLGLAALACLAALAGLEATRWRRTPV